MGEIVFCFLPIIPAPFIDEIKGFGMPVFSDFVIKTGDPVTIFDESFAVDIHWFICLSEETYPFSEIVNVTILPHYPTRKECRLLNMHGRRHQSAHLLKVKVAPT